MNPNLNWHAPTGTANSTRTANQDATPETRTSDWRFAGRWALAGPAAAVLLVEVLTVPKPVAAAVFAVILAAAVGGGVGWIARERTDDRSRNAARRRQEAGTAAPHSTMLLADGAATADGRELEPIEASGYPAEEPLRDGTRIRGGKPSGEGPTCECTRMRTREPAPAHTRVRGV